MTSTGGDTKTSRDDRLTSIRSLDPVDPSVPPPDGSRLLQALLATPQPSRRRHSGVRLLQLAPLGLMLALVAGVVAVYVVGGDRRGVEEEAAGGAGGSTIIHYVVRESWPGSDGSPQTALTEERWQLSDGSRARTLTHLQGPGPLQGKTTEDAVTSTQSLAYLPAAQGEQERIIRYRASDDFAAIPQDPPSFGAPPIGGSTEVGDPRTVPDRLANGDQDVMPLEDATVRDIPVKQFQVGRCTEPTRTEHTGDGETVVDAPQRAIVALARDTLAPVRVTLEPCDSELPDGLDTRILDYLSFEELAPTAENLKLLDMSPHPDARIVDGIEIDKAEERDDARTPRATPKPPPAASVTPSATPTPVSATP